MGNLVSISVYVFYKILKIYIFFLSLGTTDQILGAKNEIDSIP